MMLPLSAPASLLDSIFSVVASIVFKLGWTRLPIVYIYVYMIYICTTSYSSISAIRTQNEIYYLHVDICNF